MVSKIITKNWREEFKQFLAAEDQYRFQLQHPILQTTIMVVRDELEKRGIPREKIRFMKNPHGTGYVGLINGQIHVTIKLHFAFGAHIYGSNFSYELHWQPIVTSSFYECIYPYWSTPIMEVALFCGPHGERLKPIRIKIDRDSHAEFEKVEGMYRICACNRIDIIVHKFLYFAQRKLV